MSSNKTLKRALARFKCFHNGIILIVNYFELLRQR